eukprot:5342705-Amphidinium_carterae.1
MPLRGIHDSCHSLWSFMILSMQVKDGPNIACHHGHGVRLILTCQVKPVPDNVDKCTQIRCVECFRRSMI